MWQSFQIVNLHPRFFFAKHIVKMVRVSRVLSPTLPIGSPSALKGEFDGVGGNVDPVNDRVFGVLFVLKAIADRIGITKALGNDRTESWPCF